MDQILVTPVLDLTGHEYAQCRSLNLRHRGAMQSTLRNIRHENRGMVGYVVRSINEETGHLNGWALVFKGGYRGAKTAYTAHFYVRRNKRRNGVGRALAHMIREKFGPEVRVVPWSDESYRFFDALATEGFGRDRLGRLR